MLGTLATEVMDEISYNSSIALKDEVLKWQGMHKDKKAWMQAQFAQLPLETQVERVEVLVERVKEMERELRNAEEEVMEEGDSDDVDEEEIEETNEDDEEEIEETNEDDEKIETFIALY